MAKVPSVASLDEFQLIQRISRRLPKVSAKRWPVAIGDDTAVRYLGFGQYQLLTHDLLLEDVHFQLNDTQSFYEVGWKALAVNLSDIAAMGGVPAEAVVGIAIPKNASVQQVDQIYQGLSACSKKFHCPIVGGDTNRIHSGWVLSVTVTGLCFHPPCYRSNAKEGQTLWVTGQLGAAAVGWKAQEKEKLDQIPTMYRKRQCRPEPRLIWGQRLAELGYVGAMIDISDGLAGDLQRLLDSSQSGFEVDLEKIPRPRSFSKVCMQLRLDPNSILLGGGEDYELLFSIPKEKVINFSSWAKRQKIQATQIGRVTRQPKIKYFLRGVSQKINIRGYQHF